MAKRNNIIYIIIIICAIIINLLPIFNPVLRYIKYSIPLVVLLVIYTTTKRHTNGKKCQILNSYLKLYSLIIILNLIFSLIMNVELYFRTFANIYFIIAPLISIIFIARGIDINQDNKNIIKTIKFSFWVIVLSYLIELLASGAIASLKLFTSTNFWSNAIFTSAALTESGVAFVLGLFAILFLMIGDYKYYMISILFSIFSFKRIVLIGVLFCSIAYFIYNKDISHLKIMKFNEKTKYILLPILFILINLLTIYMFFNLIDGSYDPMIKDITGQSVNSFTQGRLFLYNSVFTEIDKISLTGIGIGQIDIITYDIMGKSQNLHSDIIKNYLEFGIMLFIVWLFVIYYIIKDNIKILIFTIYTNILFLTDNIFYISLVICFGFIYSYF